MSYYPEADSQSSIRLVKLCNPERIRPCYKR